MLKPPKFWQKQESLLSDLLAPLSWMYEQVQDLRFKLTRPFKAPVPVVCVGNFSMGGAGKTPVVRLLVSLLYHESAGPIHIVMRGYKGKARSNLKVDPKLSADFVGDESLLLSQSAPCWIGKNRARSIQKAVSEGASIIIMDDGFQNPSIFKDLSILVVDGPVGLGNGRVFPSGPLRESLESGLKRADAVILIGNDDNNCIASIDGRVPVFRGVIRLRPNDVAPRIQKPLYAFCGIGRPQKFFDSLKEAGLNLSAHKEFSDHYHYTHQDIEEIISEADHLGLDVVTTEKDYVRVPHHFRNRVYQIRADIVLDNPELLSVFLKKHLIEKVVT